ncbi:MAG: NAD(P)-dependent alcohol dehydrogenase, partial [Planctomycetales bacterium]|nr:NAD(P)-dependent alcohol dehydrogenase [Planctomycetales bacterium]
TALQSLRDHGRIAPGKRVLINGASGGVGAFAVQIAKHYGANVTAVASGFNEDFCLELGADNFLDYQNVDFTKSGEQWDLIFDVAGKAGYLDARRVLTHGGRFVSTEPNAKGLFMSLVTRLLSKSGTVMLAKPSAADLRELTSLYELGKLRVTIDSHFSMNQAADAHRRIEEGVDRGKVVLVNRF